MKKSTRIWMISAGVCAGLFVLLIVFLLTVDVGYAVSHAPVGLSSLNGFVFEAIGENPAWETVSLILLIVSVLMMLVQGICVFIKTIQTKKIGEMVVVGYSWFFALASYAIFELCVVNYRPVLENGEIEASFPSTHTLISVVLFGVMAVWLAYLLPRSVKKYVIIVLLFVAALVSALARLMMGVHWLTDVLGGMLLGGMIVSLCGAGFCFLRGREAKT